MLSILYQIRTACINLKTFEKYLRQLECVQTNEQTNRIFQLCWEVFKNHVTQLTVYFQTFRSIAHNTSEIFCVIAYMKHAIVHLKKNMLIAIHLVQYKFAKIRFKSSPL